MKPRTLLLSAVALGLGAIYSAARPTDETLTVVVMDPLAAPLSCPCVKGYAQRDYEKLGKFIAEKIGRPVKVHFSETLTAALQKKTDGKVDLVIGKDSVVKAEAQRNKVGVTYVAALTGKDGLTTQTGLVVVAGTDPALTVESLKGYRIVFGPADAEEKHGAALALFKDLGVPVPAKLDTCVSCTDGATQVIDRFKQGEKVATVISSYAQPLLEGCGTIKKGDLKVVGETDPVPFVTAYVSDRVSTSDRAAITAALLAAGRDAALRTALESKAGFVSAATPAAKKN